MKPSDFAASNRPYSALTLRPILFKLLTRTIIIFLCTHTATTAQANSNIKKRDLESTIEKALETFQTPGMAVGVLHQNKVVISKGFGKANIAEKTHVDAQTYFRLASTSKAFTSAALAILVDEEKIDWNDKVITYLPEFELYDPYVTREFTIIDLLTHRSGLLSGAGDSMIWPEPSGFTRAEVIANLQHLTPEYSFRATYAYSNVMYITAGELVAKISGISFENFVEQRIFKPLGMNCFAGDIPKLNLKNVAMGYGHNDKRGTYPIPRNGISQKGLMSAAAGGMVCNVEDMLKWVGALLNRKELPFSDDQLDKMWYPQTILWVSKQEREWDNTLFKSYGLGWRIANIGELKVISHTGTLSGYQAYVLMVPKLELGVVILNNGSNSAARGSVMRTIVKAYMKQAGYINKNQQDWINTYIEYLDEREQAYLDRLEVPVAIAPMSISSDQILGQYKDKWFGSFTIVSTGQNTTDGAPIIRISSDRMKTLTGTLIPFQDATYKIEWDNKNAANDAFMHFALNVKRDITGATLHPFSVNAIVNHEYRDMAFMKVISE
ncbi:MAG: CubicO group peptidase (beta-lactamase class C family) [Alphaproteobacteria bacterium]|jgi:CubicO group peptidase (beta-lactamase class C family)